jgi:hypothetical protein
MYIYIYCSSFYHKVTVSWPQTISHRHISSPQHLLMFLHLGFIPSGSNMCRRKRAPIYDLFHGETYWLYHGMESDGMWLFSICLFRQVQMIQMSSGYCNIQSWDPWWSMLIHVYPCYHLYPQSWPTSKGPTKSFKAEISARRSFTFADETRWTPQVLAIW